MTPYEQSRGGKPTSVYFVTIPALHFLKIGKSTTLKSRIATLRTACPHEIDVHSAVEVSPERAHKIERTMHRLLNQFRMKGEWFRVTDEATRAAFKLAWYATGPNSDVVRRWLRRLPRGKIRQMIEQALEL